MNIQKSRNFLNKFMEIWKKKHLWICCNNHKHNIVQIIYNTTDIIANLVTEEPQINGEGTHPFLRHFVD